MFVCDGLGDRGLRTTLFGGRHFVVTMITPALDRYNAWREQGVEPFPWIAEEVKREREQQIAGGSDKSPHQRDEPQDELQNTPQDGPQDEKKLSGKIAVGWGPCMHCHQLTTLCCMDCGCLGYYCGRWCQKADLGVHRRLCPWHFERDSVVVARWFNERCSRLLLPPPPQRQLLMPP
jgi:hypothetical protein